MCLKSRLAPNSLFILTLIFYEILTVFGLILVLIHAINPIALLKIASLFYRQSLGVFIAFYLVIVIFMIAPNSTYDLVLPFVLLKGVQYPGLVFYYKLLRPEKLVFYMNLGLRITVLWCYCFLFDMLLSLIILTFN